MTATDTTTQAHLSSSDYLRASSRQRRKYIIPSGRWLQAVYVALDVILVTVNAAFAIAVRYGGWSSARAFLYTLVHRGWHFLDQPQKLLAAFVLLYAGLIVICSQGQQLYRTVRMRTSREEAIAVVKAVTFATLLLTAFVYLSGATVVSRLIVICSGILNASALIAWRLLRRHLVRERVANGIGAKNVLIVGAGYVGQSLAHYFNHNPQLGYVFKGFLDQRSSGNARLLGSVDELSRVAKAEFADEIFITIPQHRSLVKRVVMEARKQRLGVSVVPELFDGLGRRAPIYHIGDLPVMELHREPIPELGLVLKRMLDIFVSTFVLLLSAPLLVVTAVAIKLDSFGPVFYVAPRIGKKGRRFKCYKLRTMVSEADQQKERLRHLNERSGPFFKINDDPRVTRVGRFLRKYSIDELPQLWNVIKGDMSLVGPRPHPIDDYEQYDLVHLQRLDVCPGVTGLWQVTARQDPSFERSMDLDIKYIEDWSFWLDLKILLKTLPEVLRASGS